MHKQFFYNQKVNITPKSYLLFRYKIKRGVEHNLTLNLKCSDFRKSSILKTKLTFGGKMLKEPYDRSINPCFGSHAKHYLIFLLKFSARSWPHREIKARVRKMPKNFTNSVVSKLRWRKNERKISATCSQQ